MSIVFNENWKAVSLEITRPFGEQHHEANLSLSNGEEFRRFTFSGSDDIEELASVFYAWRIEIERDIESQKEFGSVSLNLTNDGYSQVFFDSYSEIK